MRKVVHKLFWVWQFDKEEKWLNEMAAKGLALVGTGLFCRYEFEESLPGEYEVRLQLLEKSPVHPESEKYISFIEETGAEHVGSYMKWVYFRKKKSDGEFQLFSDTDSKIKQLSMVISCILILSIINLVVGVENTYLLIRHFSGALGGGSSANIIGFVNLAIGIFGTAGAMRLIRKRSRLKKDKQIFE